MTEQIYQIVENGEAFICPFCKGQRQIDPEEPTKLYCKLCMLGHELDAEDIPAPQEPEAAPEPEPKEEVLAKPQVSMTNTKVELLTIAKGMDLPASQKMTKRAILQLILDA